MLKNKGEATEAKIVLLPKANRLQQKQNRF